MSPPLEPSALVDALAEALGYRFDDADLLRQALTHPSYYQVHPDEGYHNQRLEYLGDAVLSAIIAAELFRLFPKEREGELSRKRDSLQAGEQQTRMARALGLDRHLRVAGNEALRRGPGQASALEDALEAIVGAIYLEADWETTRTTVLNWYGDLTALIAAIEAGANPKGRFQEFVQQDHANEAIRYVVEEESGPSHNPRFVVALYLEDRRLAQAAGRSKKQAEENAAREGLAVLMRETGGNEAD